MRGNKQIPRAEFDSFRYCSDVRKPRPGLAFLIKFVTDLVLDRVKHNTRHFEKCLINF